MTKGQLRATLLAALVGYIVGGAVWSPRFASSALAGRGPGYDAYARPSCELRAAENSGGSDSIDAITAKLRASYEKLQGLSMKFRQVNSWADMPESGEVSKGRLWAARGGKLRMEYTEPPGHLLVSDGWRVWVYVPENRQAVVDSVGGDGQSALAEMLLQSLDTGEAKLLGEDRVGGRKCYVILMEKPEDPPGLESLKIWVDSGSWLTRALELSDLNDNVTKFSFSDVKRLDEVDEGIFTFEAPPGVEVVESPLGEGGSR